MYTAKDRREILKRGWVKGGKMFKQPEMTKGEIFLPEFQLTQEPGFCCCAAQSRENIREHSNSSSETSGQLEHMKNITEDQLEVFHLPWNPTNMKSMKNQWIWYAGASQTRERGHHLEVASPTSLSPAWLMRRSHSQASHCNPKMTGRIPTPKT